MPSPRTSSRGRRPEPFAYDRAVAVRTETIQVSGIRCERCVGRLAAALQDHDGLESARANLMGEVVLAWDADRTDRAALVGAMARAGFRETDAGSRLAGPPDR